MERINKTDFLEDSELNLLSKIRGYSAQNLIDNVTYSNQELAELNLSKCIRKQR